MSEVVLGREEPFTESMATPTGATVIDMVTRRPIENEAANADFEPGIEMLRGPYVGRLYAAEGALKTIRMQYGVDRETVAYYRDMVRQRRQELKLFDAKGVTSGEEEMVLSTDDISDAADVSTITVLEPMTIEKEAKKPAARHNTLAPTQREIEMVFRAARLVANPMSLQWQDGAKCAKSGSPEEYFLGKQKGAADIARRACGGCVVRAECLAYALEGGLEFGIWGGVSERDRRKLSKQWHDSLTS